MKFKVLYIKWFFCSWKSLFTPCLSFHLTKTWHVISFLKTTLQTAQLCRPRHCWFTCWSCNNWFPNTVPSYNVSSHTPYLLISYEMNQPWDKSHSQGSKGEEIKSWLFYFGKVHLCFKISIKITVYLVQVMKSKFKTESDLLQFGALTGWNSLSQYQFVMKSPHISTSTHILRTDSYYRLPIYSCRIPRWDPQKRRHRAQS